MECERTDYNTTVERGFGRMFRECSIHLRCGYPVCCKSTAVCSIRSIFWKHGRRQWIRLHRLGISKFDL